MIPKSPIPTPCRTHRRAALRRVAGGALPRRGRGEAAESDTAVARDARPYRRDGVIAPYRRLQCFERAGVEEKVDKTDVRDAVVVVCPGLEGGVPLDCHSMFSVYMFMMPFIKMSVVCHKTCLESRGAVGVIDSLLKTIMKMSMAVVAPIPASCRTRCRAAVRRVRGRVLCVGNPFCLFVAPYNN